LLGYLAAHGFRVPAIIPSLDGRHIDGIVVQRWLAVFKPPFVQP
jgi:hypothetical protein